MEIDPTQAKEDESEAVGLSVERYTALLRALCPQALDIVVQNVPPTPIGGRPNSLAYIGRIPAYQQKAA
jgi:hypothetical protein